MGWDYVHVAIDDHSRIAFSRIYPNEKGPSVSAFLRVAVADYARPGIRIRRILTDNGPAYRSLAFARACTELGLKHRFTRPYTPRANGKADRFIQTALREWAYARAYHCSDHRNRDLLPWRHQYNWHRPHAGIGLAAPISRSGLDRNNLLSLHIRRFGTPRPRLRPGGRPVALMANRAVVKSRLIPQRLSLSGPLGFLVSDLVSVRLRIPYERVRVGARRIPVLNINGMR